MVKHLSHSYSDHCPLLLTLDPGKERKLGERPFRFQAMWLRHKNFIRWMKEEWCFEGNLLAGLRDFRAKLESWNKNTFGNVFQRKRRNMLRLEGVQRSLERGVSEPMSRLEGKLKLERKELLIQEELLWLQKSRNDWLKHGDSNTKFFHTSTLIRRRRNRIEALQNDRGEWIEDKVKLRDHAISFYKELFTSDPESGGELMRGCFPPLNKHMRRSLAADFTLEDTANALKGMGSMKAPGPDGYQHIFFKQTWEVTGQALYQFAQRTLEGVEVSLDVAEVLLVLIPKEEKPSSIRGFRPISLCNVCVKVVSRMLVDRLKGI